MPRMVILLLLISILATYIYNFSRTLARFDQSTSGLKLWLSQIKIFFIHIPFIWGGVGGGVPPPCIHPWFAAVILCDRTNQDYYYQMWMQVKKTTLLRFSAFLKKEKCLIYALSGLLNHRRNFWDTFLICLLQLNICQKSTFLDVSSLSDLTYCLRDYITIQIIARIFFTPYLPDISVIYI